MFGRYDRRVPEDRDQQNVAPISAAPSRLARALALAAIIIGGVCGGLIGYAFVDLQCHGDCSTENGLGLLIGAVSHLQQQPLGLHPPSYTRQHARGPDRADLPSR